MWHGIATKRCSATRAGSNGTAFNPPDPTGPDRPDPAVPIAAADLAEGVGEGSRSRGWHPRSGGAPRQSYPADFEKFRKFGSSPYVNPEPTMRLVLAAVLALLLASPAHAEEPPPPGQCFTTEAEFIESAVRVNKAKVLVASDTARHRVLDKINAARHQAGMWEFEADKLSIGVIMHQGRMLVGVAMFKDGCVVPGSVKVFEAEVWIAFLVELGLSMDDFKPEQGA